MIANFVKFSLAICLLISFPARLASEYYEEEQMILERLFGPEAAYDSRVRAAYNQSDPTVVNVRIYVRNIVAISDYHMEYEVVLTLRQNWNDRRLRFNSLAGKVEYLTLSGDQIKIWLPDTYFKNELKRETPDPSEKRSFLRIYPDGNVTWSQSFTATLSCPLNLKLYPFDVQRCQILIASYAYITKKVIYLWKTSEPVLVTKNLHLPKFTFEKFKTDYCNSKTSVGEYSCLRLDFIFSRASESYMCRYYFPSALLVVMTWLVLWLGASAGRILICFLHFTLLFLLCLQVQKELPPISYWTALEVWISVCFTFLLCAILESLAIHLVNYQKAKRVKMIKPKTKEEKEKEKDAEKPDINDKENNTEDPQKDETNSEAKKCRGSFLKSKSAMCDFIFRILFALFFISLAILYYFTYIYQYSM